MKRYSKISALVVAIGSVFPAPPASATSYQTYPGVICRQVPGSGGTFAYYYGTVYNSSTTSSLDVMCPLVKNGDAQIANGGWIEVYDANVAQDVSCQVVTAYALNSAITVYYQVTKSSSGYGSSVQTLAFDVQSYHSNAYFYALCTIPPLYSGSGSHVAAIQIAESP